MGGLASAYGANQQNKAGKNAGKVDVRTTSDPWAPSTDYRLAGMQAAYQNTFGAQPGFTQSNRLPDSYTGQTPPKKGGANLPPKNPKNRNGGGQGQQPGFAGMSSETDQIRDAMIGNAQRGNPLYGEAEGYISDTLSGQGDRNQYRTETAEALRGMDDPDLRRYKDLLFEGFQGARGGAGGGGGGGNVTYRAYSATNGPGGAPASSYEAGGPTGAAGILKGIMAGDDVPGAQAMRERIKRESDAAYADRAKDLRARAAGSGMYGGTPYQQAEAAALSDYDQRLKDAYAAQDYAMYGQALGLGTQYDIASLDRAAAERNASSMAGAASGTAANELALRRELGYMDALGGAVGMGLNQSQFQASGLGSLSEGLSNDQRFALGATGDITGLGLRDWGAAGQLSLGADQNRIGWNNSQNSLRAAQIAGGNDRARLNFDMYRYGREAPLNDVSRYMDIVNASSGNYGTRHDIGFDGRSQSPSYSNPGYAAISGAASGYALADQYRSGR